MPYLGAVADDFTGATDLAATLVARGFRTVVTVGVPDAPGGAAADSPPAGDAGPSAPTADDGPWGEDPYGGADAVVVALKSRTAPVPEAVRDAVAALRALRAAGCKRFYFKYCSTFDSTPLGNIGPVTDALLDELGAPGTVIVPSFPATGRTVYRARLFVHDDLLDESPLRDHPLTPMRDAHVGRLLAPQTRRPVALVRHEAVRAGADAVREELSRVPDALTVVDATTDEDLRVIAAATADLPLITGAAGLALGLTGPREGRENAGAGPRQDGPRAVLSGSASSMTRAQVGHARGLLPSRALDVAALRADLDGAVAGLVSFARACWRADPGLPPLIYAADETTDLRGTEATGPGAASGTRAQDTAGPDAATLVETALARCAAALVAAGARRLLVAGGETSGAVVTALGARVLSIGAPIAPGVVWTHTEARIDGTAHPVDLALKSGNFGTVDMFTTAWGASA
ncbi:3-oxo-tetronate kinase [Streptomyces sp. 8L]|uniref:3-oxo-tetronate kinase n=1 Tax=Streptomyces sp. 8L TaxID=2877242 RepID=UPI001CD2D8E0|nr:3-oxo-tetronate kinase [Streptomyces sp. 8L]MCA1219718.1 four-carbon acid sugar kinase family protein [Streptomyces sp. 8L]